MSTEKDTTQEKSLTPGPVCPAEMPTLAASLPAEAPAFHGRPAPHGDCHPPWAIQAVGTERLPDKQ